MKFTRNLLGVAIGLTSIGGPITIYAEEKARVIEEVVVTSRRREESQQDVPLSVTAWGPKRLSRSNRQPCATSIPWHLMCTSV